MDVCSYVKILMISNEEFKRILDSLTLLNNHQLAQLRNVLLKQEASKLDILTDEERLFLQTVILTG